MFTTLYFLSLISVNTVESFVPGILLTKNTQNCPTYYGDLFCNVVPDNSWDLVLSCTTPSKHVQS